MEKRLVFINLRSLNYFSNGTEKRAGEIGLDIAKAFNKEVVSAFTVSTTVIGTEFEFHLEKDGKIYDEFEKLIDKGLSYQMAIKKVLEKYRYLLAVVVDTGDELGITFLKI